jgi:hypothetical protein
MNRSSSSSLPTIIVTIPVGVLHYVSDCEGKQKTLYLKSGLIGVVFVFFVAGESSLEISDDLFRFGWAFDDIFDLLKVSWLQF